MNRRREDRLRAANPVSLDDAPSPDSPQGKATFQRIVRSPLVEPKRSRRRRFALVLVPVAFAAGIAARYEWFQDAAQPLVVVCYGSPSLNGHRIVVPASERGNVDACSSAWRRGGFFNPTGQVKAPSLTACVLKTGAVGVFPGAADDPCAVLDLPHVRPPTGSNETADITRVEDHVVGEFLDQCTGRLQAVAAVRRELDRYGLTTWKVVVLQQFTAAEPCAGLAGDTTGRTVRIVPVRDAS
jgi:hypothetical protein